MKKYTKIILLIILIFVCTINASPVYADPNSSKGFAEYDDAQAEEETQKMLEEQQKEVQATAGKSTNNYLDNLQVEGYELTPKFDKQTISYTIKGNLKSDEINIIATPSDKDATIQGTGKIKVAQDQKEFRIDVTAPSGTVRSYTIYIDEQTKQEETQIPQEYLSTIQGEDLETKSEEEKAAETSSSNLSETENKNDMSWIIIVVIAIAVVLVVTFIVVKNKKKHHRSKH